MIIDWYTTSNSLEHWQVITQQLLKEHQIRWHIGEKIIPKEGTEPAGARISMGNARGVVCDSTNNSALSKEVPRLCVVDLIDLSVSLPVAALADSDTADKARIRLAVLPKMDLSELLTPSPTSDRSNSDSSANLQETKLVTNLRAKLRTFAGVITTGEDQAEWIRNTLLIPAISIHIPHLVREAKSSPSATSNFGRNFYQVKFASQFNQFLDDVLQWQIASRLWVSVGKELAYLGAKPDMPIVANLSSELVGWLPEL
jgi:hypothetical protein